MNNDEIELKTSKLYELIWPMVEDGVDPERIFNRIRRDIMPILRNEQGDLDAFEWSTFKTLVGNVGAHRGIDNKTALKAISDAVDNNVDLDQILDYPWPRAEPPILDDTVIGAGTF